MTSEECARKALDALQPLGASSGVKPSSEAVTLSLAWSTLGLLIDTLPLTRHKDPSTGGVSYDRPSI